MLVLFFMFSFNSFAEREAKSEKELLLLDKVSYGSTEAATNLINEGISVNITDLYGQNLLMFAAKNNNKELVKLLIGKGADPNYSIDYYTEYVKLYNKQNFDVVKKLYGKRVLDFGVDSNDTDMVDLLMTLGAKLDIDNNGLNSIVANAYESYNPKMVKFLLGKGANISDATGQYLVVSSITKMDFEKANYYYTRGVNFENTIFLLMKILEENGILLDDNILLNSKLIRTEKEKSNVEYYLSTYREVLAEGRILDNTDIETTSEEIKYLYRKQEQVTEWKRLFMVVFEVLINILLMLSPIILLILIFIIRHILKTKIAYNKIKHFFQTKRTTLHSYVNKLSLIKTKIIFSKTKTKAKTKTRNIDKETNIYNIDSTEKGWIVDDTKDLIVNYLTIEDIIIPIRLTNQHERTVREMIWYIRKVENMTKDDSSCFSLEPRAVYETLHNKWKQIDPKLVRSVYKRSLLIILENYSKRYPKVNQLIKQIK